jgi:hypothetical protein
LVAEGGFEVSESIAPSLDVEDVRLVQPAVEDRRGQRLVAGE